MNKLALTLTLSACALISACNTTKKVDNEQKDSAKVSANETKTVEQSSDIAYAVAEHYFVKNTVKEFSKDPKITTAVKFNEIFGMAPVMGPSGKPTPIDFEKQYVIAIVEPETDYSTSIKPVSLQKSGGEIVFTYKVEKGEKQTYRIRPALAIIVDKVHNERLVLKQQ